MIYEKDIKTLNTNYIEKIITRYKKEITQSKNINDLKNQIKFEHIGLLVVYNSGILRITIVN